jgi:hypothetical protein
MFSHGIAETVLTVFGSGFAGWVFSRRLYRKQVDAAHLQNEITSTEIWKALAMDLKNEIKELKNEIVELKRENVELKNKVEFLENAK